MKPDIKAYLAEIGRRGGQNSKRKLTKAQARAMVRARTAKRAALRPNNGTQRPGSPDGSLATETRKPGSLK